MWVILPMIRQSPQYGSDGDGSTFHKVAAPGRLPPGAVLRSIDGRAPRRREPAGVYPPLLSLAVHEFRTPRQVVGGYLRMLQRDGGGPLTDRQRHMIDEAEKSCARLVALSPS